MPIGLAPMNKLLVIIKIITDDKTKKHLESLGLTVNSNITVLSNNSGNLICMVKDGRLALDKSIASKIFVK